jgi:hypothetical protein
VITAEVLISPELNLTGRNMMLAIAATAPKAGVEARVRTFYLGDCDWLALWGVGGGGRSAMRDRHVSSGRPVALWDMGFFNRAKMTGYCKASLDDDYCTGWLDRTEPDRARWEALGIGLREDWNPEGHIVLAGIGPKQHTYIGKVIEGWEMRKLAELRQRFPGRRIVYRPKPGRRYVPIRGVETDAESNIDDVLRGASLTVCMHSNVAVDAIIAGVPFESETNVSTWLQGKPYTPEVRLDFLRRLARWQYRASEATEAWRFLLDIGERGHA